MKANDLIIGRWYLFTNYKGVVSLCRYVGNGQIPGVSNMYSPGYMFHFLDGDKYQYSTKGVEESVEPCAESLHEYLDLFKCEEPDEAT